MSVAYKCEVCDELFKGAPQERRAAGIFRLYNPKAYGIGMLRGEIHWENYRGYTSDLCGPCFRRGLLEMLTEWQQDWKESEDG